MLFGCQKNIYQFLISGNFGEIPLTDVIKFLKLFTEIELNEISKLEKLKGEEINEAKILLANSILELAHGKEKSRNAFNSAKEIMNKEVGISNLPSVNIDFLF